MQIVFKSLSDEKLGMLKVTRDFLFGLNYETVILVPHGLKKIFIFEEETNLYNVSLWSNIKELDITKRFFGLEYAYKYATAVAKEAGLTENDIQIITEKI